MKATRSSIPEKSKPSRQRQRRERRGARWGQAHEQRGLAFADHAVDFIQREIFQPPKRCLIADLDAWFEERGLLHVPSTQDKTSDAWIAHVKRRNELIRKLRTAGRHPRMTRDYKLPTFNLVFRGGDEWEVQAPEAVILERQLLRMLTTYIKRRQHDLDETLQGVDFAQHGTNLFTMAETFHDDFDLLGKIIVQHITTINIKAGRFQQQVERSLGSGEARLMLPEG